MRTGKAAPARLELVTDSVATPEPTARSEADEWLEAFDLDFWPLYPRKVCKFASRKAWNKIRPRTQESLDAIMEGLKRWLAYWSERETEPDFIPHATTWLNQHRWEDEP